MKWLLAVLALLTLLVIPQTALAKTYDPFGDVCNVNKEATSVSSTCHTDGSNTLTGKNGTINKVTRLVALITGIAAVIMIIISGLMYITSAGDTQKMATSRTALISAVIGLVVVVLAQAIITFIMDKV